MLALATPRHALALQLPLHLRGGGGVVQSTVLAVLRLVLGVRLAVAAVKQPRVRLLLVLLPVESVGLRQRVPVPPCVVVRRRRVVVSTRVQCLHLPLPHLEQLVLPPRTLTPLRAPMTLSLPGPRRGSASCPGSTRR